LETNWGSRTLLSKRKTTRHLAGLVGTNHRRAIKKKENLATNESMEKPL